MSEDKEKNGTGEARSVEERYNKIQPKTITEAVNNQKNKSSADLDTILSTHKRLRELKKQNIKFSDPILKHGENPVFYPHTINVIQGQAGVHKSRLTEVVCSAFLKVASCDDNHLDFGRADYSPVYTVVYVDTERNLSEQLPFALQSIQVRAGYDIENDPPGFEYISLLEIERKKRFAALNEYLQYLRKKTDKPLFIVLDVATDCIEDFNKVDKSMELIDLMNMAINKFNVVFLCVIHENPKSDKARGHFGTELMNKASTVMQVGFEKDANQNDTSIIRVKYLKCRSTARHQPFYVKYSSDHRGLVLADDDEVGAIMNHRKHKASNEDMREFIELYLRDGEALKRVDLLDKLCKDFAAKQRTVETRLKEIMTSEMEIFNAKGTSCNLAKFNKDKNVYYRLKPNEKA